MSDSRNFFINSDHPMDKILFMREYTFSIPPSSFGEDMSVAHGLSVPLLVTGTWSTDKNFKTNVFSLGSAQSEPGQNPMLSVSAGADATNVIISGFNRNQSAKTVYLKIFGFAADGASGVVSAPDIVGRYFMKSDANYLKLVAAGAVNVSANSSKSITHRLGFIPQALVWTQTVGESIINQLWGGVANRENYTAMTNLAELNENSLVLKTAGNNTRFYYRIYGDE